MNIYICILITQMVNTYFPAKSFKILNNRKKYVFTCTAISITILRQTHFISKMHLEKIY